MRLLQKNSLTQTGVIGDVSLPLDIKEKDATGTWTPESTEGISVGCWLLRDKGPGKDTVFVVRSIRNVFNTDTTQVQIEHAINLLKDKIIFGEIKAKDITGNSSATTCTARQAIEYALNKQSDWVLGEFDYESVSNPYKFDGDTLYDAIDKVTKSLTDAWWSYDMTVYPFELNITQKTNDVASELRANRNLITLEKRIDRTGMFTRFFPIGKDDKHITGEYRSKNTGTYGIIDKSETDQTLATETELIAWADEELSRHAEPMVSVTAEGMEISKATGEDLDGIVLGKYCRIPLPEFGTVITERIIELSYPDAENTPEIFRATMSNKREDVTKIIADAIKRGGGGRRAAARQDKVDHAWFEDTDDHVAMVAEGIVGTDEQGNPNWTRLSEIIVDEHGIDMMVSSLNDGVQDAFSRIEQTEGRITSEVAEAVSGIAHSVIEQTATYIRTEVSNAASSISQSVIEQTTEYIQTEVSAVASGIAWSVVTQTMTNIEQQIARKSKVYIQWSDPNDGYNTLYEGDMWIKRQTNKTWAEAAAGHEKWNQTGVKWKNKYGDLIYSWKNGKWNLIKDTAVDVENEVKLEQTSTSLAAIGHAMDSNGQEFNSRLEITARQIRSEVSSAGSKLYSVIEQTSTYIRSEVSNVLDGFSSTIQQEADKISLVVEGTGPNAHIKPAAIVASINNGASNIKLSADHIDIDGIVDSLDAYDITVGSLEVNGDIVASELTAVEANITTDLDVDRDLWIGGSMHIGGHTASWKSKQVITSVTRGNSRYFVYAVNGNISNLSTMIGTLVTGTTTDAIYYLGR